MDGMPMPGKDLPAIGDEIGKYRIESVLGQGGMGAVYSARNTLTGKRVAIKWLLPEHAASTSRERLLREAQIACSIEHPNVVDIYDVGEHQGGLFLVMEYLRGQALSDVLAARGRMEPEEIIALLLPAMRGVHAAHQSGVIHRDLKPENILLSEVDGEIVPKVVDFGVSKTIGASSVPHSSLTRTGALVGTPHYMALEQVDGSNQIDPRTDVYAFGVILYRALTGHYPFDGSSLGEVILKIGTKDAQPLRTHRPELPLELDKAILRALSRSRDQRYRDLEEFALSLEPYAPGAHFHRDTSELRARSASGGGLRRQGLTTHDLASHPLSGSSPRSGSALLGSAFSAQETSLPGVLPSSLRETPPVGARQRTLRAFWVGAGCALLLLIATALWWNQRGGPAAPALPAMADPAPVSAPNVGVHAPPAPREPELSEQAHESSAAPAAALEPQVAEPDQQADPEEQAEAQAEPLETEAKPAGRTNRRVRRVSSRDSAPTEAAPKRIPGQRTKGLSIDEF